MSGHSKWATIKHKKGATDAKRGKLFNKLARQIEVAAKNGGDPDMNPTLRTSIQKAKGAQMGNDAIDRNAVVREDLLREFRHVPLDLFEAIDDAIVEGVGALRQ